MEQKTKSPSPQNGDKRCFKCHQVKPLSEFYKHSKMADGHLNKCKECTKTDVKRHRFENESVREYDRKRAKRPEVRARLAENARKWNEQNPEKYKAHYTLTNAVRDGRVVKGSCEVCGSNDRVHGHHVDYSKPLDVVWLCPRHHAMETAYEKRHK